MWPRIRPAVAVLAMAGTAACAQAERSAAEAPPPGSPAAQNTVSPPAPQHPVGDWLVYGDTTEPTTLNCTKATERSARQICRLVADSLIDFDQSYKFIPRLAESFAVSPDGLTITFRLRQRVRWHDGAPFTARDVLYTVEAMRRIDPKGDLFRTYFGPLKEVTSPDEATIEAVYAEPFSSALAGWREAIIMPEHLPYDPAAPSARDRAPVGTGPFKFVSWEPQQKIVLAANEQYFGGRPCVDRYVHRIIPNTGALVAAAEAGDVDVAFLTPEWAAANSDAASRLPFRVVQHSSSYVEMIYWNLEEPRGLFRDPRVRRALTMLLDREGYASKVQHGYHKPATTLIDPALWGGDPALAPHPYDPSEAARLLDAAGVVDRDGDGMRDTGTGPMSFTLLYTGAAPENREIASLMERGAAKAGVKVKLQGLEWPVMRPKMYAHQFEAAVFRWRLEPLPDPYAYFHSSQIASGFNIGSYRSDEFDRLSEQHRRTLDPARSAQILVELQRILHRDQPCTFIAIPATVVGIHKRFQTPAVTAAGLWNWYPSLLRWWVPAEERKYR